MYGEERGIWIASSINFINLPAARQHIFDSLKSATQPDSRWIESSQQLSGCLWLDRSENTHRAGSDGGIYDDGDALRAIHMQQAYAYYSRG